MNLRYRTFRPADTAHCLRLLEIYPDYPPEVLADLPAFWKRLCDERAMIAVTVEEWGATTRIVGIGATVFVSDGFMCETRAAREPNLVARLVRRELEGKSSPVLRRNAIARANAADGLNAIILHAAPKKPAPGESGYAFRYYLKEAILWAHRGYRIREGLQEIWDEDDLEWVQAYQSLRSDYASYYAGRDAIPELRPRLYGVTAEEALRNPSSLAAAVFLYTPPRFLFPRGAQELLECALDGETDTALAGALHISLPAVKMRWRQIYDRVETVAPELLHEAADRPAEQSRGKEKRRHIVEYIRNHPEELRPYAPQQRSTGRASERARVQPAK